MDRQKLFHGFIFYDHRLLDHHVDPEAQIDLHLFVCYRQGDFTGHAQTRLFKIICQALLVNRFQEARAEGLVDFNGAVNDVSRYFFDVSHLGTAKAQRTRRRMVVGSILEEGPESEQTKPFGRAGEASCLLTPGINGFLQWPRMAM